MRNFSSRAVVSEGGEGTGRRFCLAVLRFVIEKRDLEMAFACGLLQETKVVIGVRAAFAIPVDYKCGDPHATSLLNLSAKDGRVLAGVADIHVAVISEPRHIDCKKLGRQAWRLSISHRGGWHVVGCRPACPRKQDQGKA